MLPDSSTGQAEQNKPDMPSVVTENVEPLNREAENWVRMNMWQKVDSANVGRQFNELASSC